MCSWVCSILDHQYLLFIVLSNCIEWTSSAQRKKTQLYVVWIVACCSSACHSSGLFFYVLFASAVVLQLLDFLSQMKPVLLLVQTVFYDQKQYKHALYQQHCQRPVISLSPSEKPVMVTHRFIVDGRGQFHVVAEGLNRIQVALNIVLFGCLPTIIMVKANVNQAVKWLVVQQCTTRESSCEQELRNELIRMKMQEQVQNNMRLVLDGKHQGLSFGCQLALFFSITTGGNAG